MPLNETEIREIIEDSAFAWKVDELMAAARTAIRMHAERCPMEDLPLGASRLGGLPDLPEGLPWPEYKGRPIDFLAQINFAEAAAATKLQGLPGSGWMVVFFDQRANAEDAEDVWRGLIFDCDPASLQRLGTRETDEFVRGAEFYDDPTPNDEDFHPCALTMASWTCSPDRQAFMAAGIEGGGDPYEDWCDVQRTCKAMIGEPYHLLGGLPSSIQGHIEDSQDWHLVLQLDTDLEGPCWQWGDMGRMYFMATEKGLAERDFNQFHASWDCY